MLARALAEPINAQVSLDAELVPTPSQISESSPTPLQDPNASRLSRYYSDKIETLLQENKAIAEILSSVNQDRKALRD